jgi:hypothetical protein
MEPPSTIRSNNDHLDPPLLQRHDPGHLLRPGDEVLLLQLLRRLRMLRPPRFPSGSELTIV